jgi:hypothetical protein
MALEKEVVASTSKETGASDIDPVPVDPSNNVLGPLCSALREGLLTTFLGPH